MLFRFPVLWRKSIGIQQGVGTQYILVFVVYVVAVSVAVVVVVVAVAVVVVIVMTIIFGTILEPKARVLK